MSTIPQVSALLDLNVTNLITLQLNIQGPFRRFDASRNAMMYFNPNTDIEVYVDGILTSVASSSYDVTSNAYHLYLKVPISSDNVVQIIHHMPAPPFVQTTSLGVFSFGFGNSFGTSFGS